VKSLSLISCALISVLFSGCGVQNQSVENHPPVIRRDLVSFATTYGSFKVNQVSVFLWPAGLTEDQTEELVATVNGASLASDPFMVKAATLGVEAQGLQTQWDQISCVDHYAVLQPGQDPMDIDTVNEWKSDTDIPDQKARGERDTCQANQTRRQAIPAEQDAARQSALPYLNKIINAIDPDPQHPVNSKALDVAGTHISINRDGANNTVNLSLGNFLVPGYSPSTSNGQIKNAAYSLNLKVLSFDVDDVDDAKKPTGLTYHFALERGPDHGPLARFAGEMDLMNGSVIVRYGSSRIDAFPPQ
jgi:hypothetical protein